MNKKLLVAILLLAPITAFSAETAETSQTNPKPTTEKVAPESKWSGEAELGYLKTSGNTDTQSLHTKGKIVNERVNWKHKASIEVIKKDEAGIVTAKRTYITAQSDYNISPFSYLFVTLSYEDDDFSGYNNQFTEAVGYGYHIIKQTDMKLDLELGVGARQSELTTGATINESLVKGALDFEWKFSKSSVFTQHLSVEAGEDNTISRSVTAVKVQVVGNLSAKFSHSIKNSSDAPVGTEKTDTESIVTLVYSF